jgi:hypothetical protein
MWQRLKDRFFEWYYGPWKPYENPDADVVIIGGDHDPSLPARLAQAIVGFCIRLWRWIIGIGAAVILGSIALLTYLQGQEPFVIAHIDHKTKLLSLSNSTLVPVTVRGWAVEFGINLVKDTQGHFSISKDAPIGSFYTRGAILLPTTIWSFSTVYRDLTISSNLHFEEWTGQISDYTILCIGLDEKAWLGKSATDVVLTPTLKFSASLFGELSSNSGFGGGYSKIIFDVENQIKKDCKTMIEKFR